MIYFLTKKITEILSLITFQTPKILGKDYISNIYELGNFLSVELKLHVKKNSNLRILERKYLKYLEWGNWPELILC